MGWNHQLATQLIQVKKNNFSMALVRPELSAYTLAELKVQRPNCHPEFLVPGMVGFGFVVGDDRWSSVQRFFAFQEISPSETGEQEVDLDAMSYSFWGSILSFPHILWHIFLCFFLFWDFFFGFFLQNLMLQWDPLAVVLLGCGLRLSFGYLNTWEPHNPNNPCMVYLATFTIKINQM